MASAIAVMAPPANRRQPSMLDGVFDMLGNAVARFDRLTGARITAGDLNAGLMPPALGAMRVASEVKHTTRQFVDKGADLLRVVRFLANHPRAVIRGAEGALLQHQWAQRALAAARFVGGEINRDAHTLRWEGQHLHDVVLGPYPEKGNWLDRHAWDAYHGYKDYKAWLKPGKWVKNAWDFAVEHRGQIKDFLHASKYLKSAQFIHQWWAKGKAAAIGGIDLAQAYLKTHPRQARFLNTVLKVGERVNTYMRRADKFISPLMLLGDGYNLWNDVRNRDWKKGRGDLGQAAWDAWSTANAYGGKPVLAAARLFFTKTPWGRALATKGLDLVENRIFPWAEKKIPWLEKKIPGWLERIGIRGGGRAAVEAGEAGLERVAIAQAERVGPGLIARGGPWVWAGAALAGLIGGSAYAYYHPKETKKFFRDIGNAASDFYHTVRTEMRGDTAKGWHPWADFTASAIRLGWDRLQKDRDAEHQDVEKLGHAINKIRGVELPPGVKPPPPRTWKQIGWDILRNDVIGAMPVIGDQLGEVVDQASALWHARKALPRASRPHIPAPPARSSVRLHAPPAGRSPQPRRQGAANIPTKTQAEIRVRFDNLPSGTHIGPRSTGIGTQVETGAQFAF